MMADARNQPRRSNWNSRGLRRRDRDRRRRQRSRERMDRAALVVEVDEAVMMIGVRLRGRARQVHMHVAGDRHRFKDIERVVVDQGNDAERPGRRGRAQAAIFATSASARAP